MLKVARQLAVASTCRERNVCDGLTEVVQMTGIHQAQRGQRSEGSAARAAQQGQRSEGSTRVSTIEQFRFLGAVVSTTISKILAVVDSEGVRHELSSWRVTESSALPQAPSHPRPPCLGRDWYAVADR